jgi:hypothetical protein
LNFFLTLNALINSNFLSQHKVSIPRKIKNGAKRGRGRPSKSVPTKKRQRRRSHGRGGSVSDETEEEQWDGDGESEDEYEVEKIVEVREKKDGSREFLVHWKRWSSEHDTWEPEANLSCPDLIERFMKRVDDAKNSNFKELRIARKHTDRYTVNTHDSGRRLSKRGTQKQRKTYYDAEDDDED